MISKRNILLASGLILLLLPAVVSGQNERAPGYMSLWSKWGFPLEYGYKYSGGMATFSSQHKPLAIYSKECGKTFFVFNGTSSSRESHLQIMISYYDHKTKKVPKPVIVYDKQGVTDPQDNAAISIDSQGFIWIFISGRARTRPGLIFKSTLPYKIDSFEKILQDEMVFPQPWWMNDSCFMLMHTKVIRGRELYWTSSADGKTWLESRKLASMGGHHQITNATGNKLVSVFSYFPEGNMDKRTNIYFIQTEDFGRTWKTIDNKVLSTPITDIHSESLVKDYESEKKLVYLKDVNFDSEQNPVILALLSHDYRPGPAGNPREWMVIYWRENKWNFSKVCESGHNHDMGSIYIQGNDWRIIAPTGEGPQKEKTGGEIELWTSSDQGVTWTRKSEVTKNSKWNNSFVRRPLNANDNFFAFWADGDPDKISESRIYFTNKNCDKVWVLPYNMKKDFEKPLRIK